MKTLTSKSQHGELIELGRQLVELLSRRDKGILSQAEYEKGLDGIRAGLPPGQVLFERDLTSGATRFILREHPSGRCLNMFEFCRCYSNEC